MIVRLLLALFQTALWMQAEASTPTYPPSLPPLYVYTIPEGYRNNRSIYENEPINAANPVIAIDPGSFPVTYSIPAYSVNSDKFCMKDNASGLIYVCQGVIMDREVLTPGLDPARASLQLTVTASNRAFTSSTAVYVYLTDVNDNTPQMTNLPDTISLLETTPVSTTQIFTVTATDRDQTFFPTYSIINSNTFSVVPSTGVISLSGSLDYNTQSIHSLIITLKDQLNDSIALASTSTLIVMVTPVSHRPPVFTQTSYSANVFENSTNGTAVVQVSAYDGDRGINDTIIYSIISGNNPLTTANITSPSFSIGLFSGVISVMVSRLRWEVYSTYTLQVQGTKRNTMSLTSTTTVTITVIDDMSDNTPMFVQPSYSASVPETSPVGLQVLSVSAIDPAVLNNIRFFFAIFNTSVPFSIDQSGIIRVNGSIDYAVAMNYSFQVIAVEYEVPANIRKTATTLVTISVEQLNRYYPVFDNATYSVSLYEANLYPTALTVHATDADLGTFGVVSYQIIQSDNGLFVINSTSGVIIMTVPLNYTVKTRYTLVIQATDGAPVLPKTGQCSVVINVLAIITLPPRFISPAPNVSILETTPPGTFLYMFKYMDPNPVVPPAIPVLTMLNGTGLFTLNGSSLYTNASFNYDIINNYTLVLLLNNSVYTSMVTFQVLLIHVNKFSPVFVNSTYYFEVSESAANGTLVGIIRASDADTGLFGMVQYSLSGAGSNSFAVNMTTGVIVTSSLLNRLANPLYGFLGVASDSDPNASTRNSITNITIKVTNDNNHPPMFSVLQVYSVLENTPILLDQSGLPLVVTASTLNMGAYASISYQIVSGNINSLFLLDISTGRISRNPFMVIDKEQTPQYNIIILAFITSLPSLNSSVMVTINIIDTNDHTPEFSSTNYSTTLSEATPPGFIFQFTATDLDTGTNAQLTFSIVTSISTFKASIFSITSNGTLFLTGALNREAFAGPYGITVMVTDAGAPPLNSTSLLLVYITDFNDNVPLFPLDVYSIQLKPSLSPTYAPLSPTYVTTVTAFDNDQAGTPNSNVTYTIYGSTGRFSINKVTGVITTSSSLLSQDSCNLLVIASDQGTPSLSSNATVNIIVAAIYDATPNCSLPGYVFNVTETTSVNTRLEGITASAGVGVAVVYSTDDFIGPFDIDPVTAELVLVSELSYWQDKVYELTVEASNAFYPSKRSMCNVTILILQVNRHSPVFNSSNYITSVMERSPNNTSVIKVTATDLDVGMYGMVTYSITGGNMGGAFSINQSTGQLSTKVLINRSVLVYTLTIMATDGGSPPRSSVVVATVTVVTSNDYAPVFTSAMYTGSVPEATPPGFTIVRVIATDGDFGSNAIVRYSINDTTNFVIHPIYGVVTTNATFLFGVQSYYIINVTAYDLGTPPLSTSTVITVQVLPLNLHPPMFASTPPPLFIREDVPVNYSVVTLVATDTDTGPNALLSFSLANDLGYFSINPNGTIFVNAPMKAVSSFNLTVIASDCGSPQRSSAVTYVPISILDIDPLPPTFTQAVYMVQVTYPNGVNVTMRATDLDFGTNTNITFAIAKGDTSVFGLRVDSGPIVTVYNKQPLIQPAYSLRIDAFNIYQNQTRSSATLSIVVSRIKTIPSVVPSFGVTSFTQTISEASPIGTILYPALYAVANTSSPSITYSLEGCGPSFSVDAITGNIELTDILDREVVGLYNCTLLASNGFGNTSTSLSIIVLDSNDNTPIFSSTLYRLDVREGTRAGKSIGRVMALDADQGSNAMITYTILSGDDIMAPKFSIIPSTGVIFTTTTPLDRNGSYLLTVQANDSVNQATAVVYVTVEDQNDHTPMFVGAPYVSNISETTLIIATLQATDADAGMNAVIKFSIYVGNTTVFQIDENSGLVTARPNMLRYGNQATYTLLVLAVDQAVDLCERRTAITTVTINLLPSNDHRPVFSQDTYSISIFESISVGQIVFNVTVTDDDPGVSGQFTYRANQNLSSSSFSINSLSGSIKSTSVLDREVQSTHLLILEAVDKGTPPLTGTAALYITLLDVNDNAPYFSVSYYSVSIGEATPINSGVTTLQASDADLSTELTYSISGDPYRFFKINSYTGLIQTARRLDNEASSLVTLTVQASDGLNSGFALVQISVTDSNDKPPQFSQSNYNCTTIPENSPAGTRVSVLLYDGSYSRIVAMDPDVPSTPVVYQLSGNAFNYFSINQTTGVMFAKPGVVLDRESRNGYWIFGSVVAIDGNGLGLSSTAQLSVQISNVIEHPPVFSEPLGYSLALWENTPLQTVSNQITATSVDIRSIGYSIIGTSPWPLPSSLLAIDASSGLLNLTGAVDREVFPFSNHSLQARGNVIPALFTTTSIQVCVLDTNDKAPQFDKPVYTAIVMENITVGGAVLQVCAVDPDLGYGGVVMYSIMSSNGPFFINPTTGLLSTTDRLNYKTKRVYNISVQACDSGSPVMCSNTLASVQVLSGNDHAPLFTYPTYQLTIPSNLAQNSSIIRPVAMDEDPGAAGQITYSILSSSTDLIRILDPASGLIVLSRAINSSEVGSTFTFSLAAVDGGTIPLTGTSTLIISINTLLPARFEFVFYEASVPENMMRDFMHFTTTSNVATYYLPSNLTNLFKLTTTTTPSGNVVATISTQVTLDREQVDQYNVLITGNISQMAAQSVTIRVLDVNDNYPTFLQPLYSFSLMEGVGPSAVGVVAAFDLDAGNNGTVVYSLLSTSNPNDTFIVNKNTGQLNTTGPLNREKIAVYNLTVIGMDLGTPVSLSTLVTVLVTVSDVNDNPPIFSQASYTTSIFDNAPIGSSVAMVAATDVDVGTNAQIWYSIWSGSNGQFIIDSTTGLITTNSTLRYVVNSAYTLVVIAMDRGMPALSTNVTVMVYLNNSNDCTPALLSKLTSLISIAEGPQAVSLNVSLDRFVVDCDPGPAGISYSILAGNTLSWFSINSTSGVITMTTPLDRENISSFLLTVQAKDGFPSALALSSQLEISVLVLDINDNPPVFPVSVYYITVYEDTPTGQTIFTMAATDRDATSNAAVIYSLAGQSTFISVTPTGSIVAKTLSRGRFNVTVIATDGGTPPMNSTAVVSVTVLGVNSNSPVFTNVVVSPRTSVSINENTSIGDVIFVVAATDRDAGSNGQVAFSFGLGNEDGKFSIQPYTGIISVVGTLNYRLTQYYQLTVMAQDMGTPPRSSSATLTVQILAAINYYTPVFRFTSYIATPLDTTTINTSVISMTATDADVPGTPAASVTYLLVGPNSGYFRIDNSGNVYTNRVLNQRLISSFLLEGVAINSYASPVLFSSVNLMVTVVTGVNNRPIFVQTSYAISIPELTSPGTTVLTLLATDIDQPGTPNSLISYSFPLGSPSNVFTLLPSGNVVLYGTLDWSATAFYKLTVCASDAGAPSAIVCVPLNITILDQNTYPPVFKYHSYSVSVYENVTAFPWPLYVNLSYTDRDSVYNALSAYFIVTVNRQYQSGNTFSLNQSTGALVLNEMVEVLKTRAYEIEIMVVNIRMGRGSLCTSSPCRFQDFTTITVNVLDVNDHFPVFNSSIYYIYISNDTAVGTTVTSLSASDLDDGILGQDGVTYLFYGTMIRVNPFRIETHAGGVAVIYTSSLLGSYDGMTFNLPVVAKDGGLPPNTNSTNVSIMVLSNTKRLLVMFGCNVSTLYPLQAVIVDTLNKYVPGYNVTVETIKPHIDPSTGLPVSNITELVFHVYDVQNKTYIDYLLYYNLTGMLESGNASSVFYDILSDAIPAACSVQTIQPISQIVVPPTAPPPITFTPYTPGKNYTEINIVTVTVATLPVIVVLPARVDIQILIVMVFCGVLALVAFILTLLSFYQRYVALHDTRTKLLADVFYGNQGTTMVENLQLQSLQLDELNSNIQIQRDNPIFVHPYEDWIGTVDPNDPTKASIGEESSATRQLDNPLYEEQELRMDMFSQDSDEDGEVDDAELLAAALQDDDDNEDNTITAI